MPLTNEQLKALFASEAPDDQLFETVRQTVPAFQGLDDATAREQFRVWRTKARAGGTNKALQALPETTNIIDALRSGFNRSAAATVGEPIANILSMIGAKQPAAEYKQASKNLASGPVPKGAAANIAYLATRVPGLAMQYGLPFMFPGYGGAAAGGAYIGAQNTDDPFSIGMSSLMGLGSRFGLNKLVARRAAASAARAAASEITPSVPASSTNVSTPVADAFTRLIPGAQPISITGIPGVTTETLPRTVQTAKGLIKPPTGGTPGVNPTVVDLLTQAGIPMHKILAMPPAEQQALLQPLLNSLSAMAGTIK